MKKFLSILISTTFIFSGLTTNTFANSDNFKNLGSNSYYYGVINGELEIVNGRTIFLLEEKNGTTHQIFSSKKAKEIETLFLNKNNVKILGQTYENPNNKKYAGIFVNKIWNLDIPKTIKKYKTTELNDDEKILAYHYLLSNNSKNKFLEGKKIFGNVNLNQIYKEMSQKDKNGKINKELFSFIKYLYTDTELNSDSKNFLSLDKTAKKYKLLNQEFLSEIEKKGSSEIKKIFNKKNTGKDLSDSEKFLFNELNSIEGFEIFLDQKISSEKSKNIKNIEKISKLTSYKTKNNRIQYLFKNTKNLKNIFLQKEESKNTEEFFKEIKSKIIISEINTKDTRTLNQKMTDENFWKNLILNSLEDQIKIENFLNKNKSEKILKISTSRDYTLKSSLGFKMYYPHNFDYQEIKIGNNTFSKIYFKDFYSNDFSVNINKVQKFSEIFGKKTSVKLAGNYGSKFIINDKVVYQIKNQSGEKFEISYSTKEENFKIIFQNILNKIN